MRRIIYFRSLAVHLVCGNAMCEEMMSLVLFNDF